MRLYVAAGYCDLGSEYLLLPIWLLAVITFYQICSIVEYHRWSTATGITTAFFLARAHNLGLVQIINSSQLFGGQVALCCMWLICIHLSNLVITDGRCLCVCIFDYLCFYYFYRWVLTDLLILLGSIDGPRLGRLVITYYKLGFKQFREPRVFRSGHQ